MTTALLAPTALPSATLAVASPWASRSLTLPALGNLDAYISAVNRMPLLTLDEEQGAARRLGGVQRKGRDALAVGSNLPDTALTFMNKRGNAHRDSLS